MNLKKPDKFFICIVAAVCLLFLCNLDIVYVSKWGIQLLDCIREGRFRNFAVILKDNGINTNYSILTNGITAIWFAPVYFLDNILQLKLDIVIYCSWYKILIGIIMLFSVKIYRQILSIYDFSDDEADFAVFLYVASPIVMLAIIGGGQVDAIGNLFLLISLQKILIGNYKQSAIFGTLAILIKGIAIMIFIPWIILLCKPEKIKMAVKMFLFVLAGIVGQYILSDLLFQDYNLCVHELNQRINFVGRLFEVNIRYTNIFLLLVVIICYLCFYFAEQEKVELQHFFIVPILIMISFIIFVHWNPQYLIYMMPLLVIMGCYIKSKFDFLALFFMLSFGYVMSVTITDNQYYDSNGMINNTFMKILVGKEYTGPFIEDYLNTLSPYIVNIGRTLMSASLVLLCLLYYLSITDKMRYSIVNKKIERFLLCIQPIPIWIFLIVSFYLYFKYI